ncbi:MAG: hypothetical protein U9R38_07980 [Candidatus Margulisiibacteriota bacterium]|nr:hypothetical protein [Candidatus Margulisiibacteriota bacterium]
MKKLLLGIVILLAVAVSGADALIGAGIGLSANLARDPSITGLALEVNLPIPIIPLMATRLEANYYQVSNPIAFTMIPVMITQTAELPMLPIYAGFGVGITLLSSSNAAFVAPSTVLNYNGYVGYKKSLMPLTDFFIQGGYTSSKFDLGAGLSYDNSGFEVKTGIRFGI